MSVLAIQVDLIWTKPHGRIHPSRTKRMQEMQQKLHFDWAYEEKGPVLQGELQADQLSPKVINDMEVLYKMDCIGNVVFAKYESKYPIIKCILSVDLTWWAGKDIKTPVPYDPIEGRKKE